jgi:PAS domain S-box-containing protein
MALETAFPTRFDDRRRWGSRPLVVRDLAERGDAIPAQARLAAVVESSEDAIYTTTLGGIITSWNAAAARIYGYPEREMIGRPLHRLISPGRPDETPGILRRMKEGARISHYETVRIRHDGTELHISLTVSPVMDAAGEISEVSFIARDITERKRLEQEILDIAEREQQRIGRDLHDGLCQQLAGIVLMCQAHERALAGQGRDAEKSAPISHITRLTQEAIRQARELARGLFPVTLAEGGLPLALQELASYAERLLPVSCRCVCEADAPSLDPVAGLHLYRIAQEALTNAVRHGEATQVVMTLASGAGCLTLTVTDNGTGLPRSPRRHPGMGLRIMNYRADLIGASLKIERAAAGGTVISCSLRVSASPLEGGC